MSFKQVIEYLSDVLSAYFMVLVRLLDNFSLVEWYTVTFISPLLNLSNFTGFSNAPALLMGNTKMPKEPLITQDLSSSDTELPAL